MKKQKPCWEMNTEELAEATRQFDDPAYSPPAVKPTRAQRAQLDRWQRKRAAARARLTLSLDKQLIGQNDNFAANHGQTFSDVVSDALRKFIGTCPD
jgi:hypothetical protein